jgi:hypothetical protein
VAWSLLVQFNSAEFAGISIMTPELKARQQIDPKLEKAGWVIQDMKELNLSAGVGVAVCECPTDTLEAALSAIVSEGENIAYGLKQSTAQRPNILRAAFAGQLVPQDPNEEPASVLLERIRTERAAQTAVKKPRARKQAF